MAESQRGERDVLTAVPLTETLFYAWMSKNLSNVTGVSASDLTALGHLSGGTFPTAAGVSVVYSPQRPTPARYTKRLTRNPAAGQQATCTTFGDGTQAGINRAAAAGWRIVKGIILPSRTSNPKSITVGARLPNGLIYLRTVPRSQATAYPELGLETSLSFSDLRNAVSGSQRPHPAIATKQLSNGTITMPCSFNKMDDAFAAGWKVSAPII